MADKSYWDELRKQPRSYSVGDEGWQVNVYWEENKVYRYKNGTPRWAKESRQVIEKPWRRNAALSADLKVKMLKDRIVAEAATDRDDFWTLLRRIDPEDWETILKDQNLRGPALASWLKQTPTNEEFANHLRYG
ncbi:MAG: hypothetical protein JHC54_05735 [Acinetobacter sp.]|nr:hypothetical protein [Acinetobacter sp.]